MAALYPPFHALPAGPLTAEPLVEFNEQYNLNVEGRWNLDDWSRVPSFTKTPEAFRQHAINAARHWHNEDTKNGTSVPKRKGPAARYPDIAPPGETPEERHRRKQREAHARWRERNGMPALGTKPVGRPRKDGQPAGRAVAKVALTVDQLRALLVWCSQNSYEHDDASLAAWLSSVGAAVPATDPA